MTGGGQTNSNQNVNDNHQNRDISCISPNLFDSGFESNVEFDDESLNIMMDPIEWYNNSILSNLSRIIREQFQINGYVDFIVDINLFDNNKINV